MRCTQCEDEIPDASKQCSQCGQRLGRPSRARTSANPDPWKGSAPINRAYRCSFYGLIPPLGLVLGVVAVVLGVWALCFPQANVDAKPIHAKLAIGLGGLTALTNWIGLYLMLKSVGIVP